MSTKKNKGIVPECKDERLRYVPTKCGKCIECRKERKREWRIRMSEELKNNRKALFVTLTFSPKEMDTLANELFKKTSLNYEEENELAKTAVRRFLERIRKVTGKSRKHWLITEKGEDYDRIHLHGIMWCEDYLVRTQWKYGFIYIGQYVNDKTINYITKYILKEDEKHRGFQGKIMASPGIGAGYENGENAKRNRFKGEHTNEMYKLNNGIELPLPKYYHDKIYTEEEREKLWIIKQERGYRYIAGEKVSTDNLEEWDNLTRYYQDRAKRLYNENPEEWEIQKQRRKLERMKIARLKMRRDRKNTEVPEVSEVPEVPEVLD